MIAYKLLSQRKDGSLGSLFIGRRKRIPVGKWMHAEDIPTKGYAHRPGFHCLAGPVAPHLSERNRVWAKVEIEDFNEFLRPENQGGRWFLSQKMKVVEIIK